MKTTNLPGLIRYLATALALGLLGANVLAGNTPAVRQYLVAKGQSFVQAGAGAPTLGTNDPFQAMVSVDPASSTSVSSASVQIPGGTILTLATNDSESEWKAEYSFSTKAAMDAAAPAGAYKFTIVAFDGPHSPTLTLSADDYPNAPHLANWSALQTADASGDILVTWDPFIGGTINDFVQFRIEDNMGTVVRSGENPGQPGALNGTNTSFLIPGGTLEAGSTYHGSLLFAQGNFNTNVDGGMLGIAAYFKETQFSLSTTSAPPDAGRFHFAQAAYSVREDELGVVLTVLRAGGSSGNVSVMVNTRHGTALPGINYGELSTRLDFSDGVESVDLDLIQIVDHSTLDGTKTFFVTLSEPSGGADLGSPVEATVSILDTENRGAGTFGFSAPMYMATESAGSVAVTITRTGGASGEVSIVYTTIAGSAESGEDFLPSQGTLIFSNGVAARTINITIVPDDIDESNETFLVSLFNPTDGAALSPNDTATVVIKDDDTAGTLAFSAALYPVRESETNLAVIVRRTGGAADDVSVDLVITGGTATRGDDYDHADGTTVELYFEQGQTAVTNIFAIHDDQSAEGDETILLSLRNPEGGARLAGITNATIKILDDEVTLQFSASDYTNKETAGAAVIFVERTGPLNVAAFVTVRTSGGSATPLADYIPTNVVVNFPVGVKKKPVAIRLINDYLVEDPETIDLILENPSDNALIGPRDDATVHLLSEDLGGVIQFATANLNVAEARPFVPVVITRTGGLASNVTVHLQSSEMSAHDPEDYIGTNVTLTFGAREVKKTILIPIVHDTIFEGLETFMVHLTNPTGGASLGGRSDAIVVILDNDLGGVISFARPEIIVNENATNAVVVVNRTGGAASEVKVRLATANGTATEPDDYEAFNQELTFAAGERSKTNLIHINNDTLAEGAVPETIRLSLTGFLGGGRPGISNAVIKIVDDESSVSFTNDTVTAVEGRVLTVAVVRAGALNTPVTVDYMTMDGTATAGADYRGTNGTLTFPPNIAVRFITVPILSDSATETNDNFTVVLKNPQGGVLPGLKTNLVVTIQDAPDPAAVSPNQTPFFKATVTGAEGITLSKSINILGASGPGGVISGAYSTNTHTFSEISGVVQKASLESGQVRNIFQSLQFGHLVTAGPGVVPVDSTEGNGNGGWVFSDTRGATTLESHAYGNAHPGASGSITIDYLDPNAGTATGRFDFILPDDTGDHTRKVHLKGSFCIKNLVVN